MSTHPGQLLVIVSLSVLLVKHVTHCTQQDCRQQCGDFCTKILSRDVSEGLLRCLVTCGWKDLTITGCLQPRYKKMSSSGLKRSGVSVRTCKKFCVGCVRRWSKASYDGSTCAITCEVSEGRSVDPECSNKLFTPEYMRKLFGDKEMQRWRVFN